MVSDGNPSAHIGNLGERFMNRFGMRLFAGAFASLLVSAASVANLPSASAVTPAAPVTETCAYNLITQETVCVSDDAQLAEAVKDETGYTLLPVSQMPEEGGASRSGVTPMATYIVGELYTWPSYGGTRWVVTASGDCGTWQIGDFSVNGWQNDVDSFKSFGKCKTTLYDNKNFGGAKITGTDLTSLGAMQNQAESGKWTKA